MIRLIHNQVIYLGTNERVIHMGEKPHKCGVCMQRKHSVHSWCLSDTKEYMQERGLTNVMSVTRSSVADGCGCYIKEHTQGRNHTNVNYVKKGFT